MAARSIGILWFKHVTDDDTFNAGVAGVKLGEMQQAGFPVPNGFIVTSLIYFQFIKTNKLITKITPLLATINFDLPESIMQVSKHIQKIILQSPLPEETVASITQAYTLLGGVLKNSPVTLTFSSTGSKQQLHLQTLSHVHGEANLLLRMKQAWASLFEPQALLERANKHIDHFAVGIAVTIQQEIIADVQGIMMTTDPLDTTKNHLIIEAFDSDGTLDHYAVDKTLHKNELREHHSESDQLKLTEEQIRILTKLGKSLEKFLYFPQEVTWAIKNNSIYLLGTKPLHMHGLQQDQSALATKLPLIMKAVPGAHGIASGIVKIIDEPKDLMKINNGEILILAPDVSLSASYIKKTAGLITEQASRMSPVVLMAREYGIPVVITPTSPRTLIKINMVVTIDGTKGWIYKGSHTQHNHNQTATKIFALITNVHQSSELFETVEGVVFEPDESVIDQPIDVEEQILSLCHALQNRPVVYRMFDQKNEKNYLLGIRGTAKSLQQPDLLHKELSILQQVKKHTTNVWLMQPFVRNVAELTMLKHVLSDYGFTHASPPKLWISIETPSNVHQLEEFIRIGIDGVSIDSDMLTTLFVGADKDNSEIAHTYDVLDSAVLSAFQYIIKTCQKHGITSSIHGYSVLHHPTLIEKLVTWGINNIIVPADMIDQLKAQIISAEKKLVEYN